MCPNCRFRMDRKLELGENKDSKRKQLRRLRSESFALEAEQEALIREASQPPEEDVAPAPPVDETFTVDEHLAHQNQSHQLTGDKQLLETLLHSEDFRKKINDAGLNLLHFYSNWNVKFDALGPIMEWKDSKCINCPATHTFYISLDRESCKVAVKCDDSKAKSWGVFKEVLDKRIQQITYDPDCRAESHFMEEAKRYAREDFNVKSWEIYSVHDPYTFDDYTRELTRFLGSCEAEVLYFAATRINRVMAFITPDEYCIKKNIEDEKFHLVKKLPVLVAKFTKKKKDKMVMVELKHSTIVAKLQWHGVLRIYNRKAVVPTDAVPRTVLNMWTGFHIDNINAADYPPIEGALPATLRFIKQGLCGGDETVYNAFMRIFQYLIKFPSLKVPWCIYLYTQEKRMGKSLYATWLQTFIFGKATMKMFGSLREFCGQFNGWLVGKKLCWVEECSATKEEFRSLFDQIKGFITSTTSSCNPKFVNAFDVENYASLGINTNHKHALYLEPGDRRYLCPEVKLVNPGADKNEYFKELAKDMFNYNTALEFVRYLRETKDFDHIDPMHDDPPMTQLKLDIIEYGFMSEHKFIQELGLRRFRYLLTSTYQAGSNGLVILKQEHARGLEMEQEWRRELNVLLEKKRNCPLSVNEGSIEYLQGVDREIKDLDKKYNYAPLLHARKIDRLEFYLPKLSTYIKDLTEEDKQSPAEERLQDEFNVLVERRECLLTTEQIYALYCNWFKERESTGVAADAGGDAKPSILKSPKLVDLQHFFRRISGLVDQSTRASGIRKIRRYDIDTTKDIYLNWAFTKYAREAMQKVNAQLRN